MQGVGHRHHQSPLLVVDRHQGALFKVLNRVGRGEPRQRCNPRGASEAGARISAQRSFFGVEAAESDGHDLLKASVTQHSRAIATPSPRSARRRIQRPGPVRGRRAGCPVRPAISRSGAVAGIRPAPPAKTAAMSAAWERSRSSILTANSSFLFVNASGGCAPDRIVTKAAIAPAAICWWSKADDTSSRSWASSANTKRPFPLPHGEKFAFDGLGQVGHVTRRRDAQRRSPRPGEVCGRTRRCADGQRGPSAWAVPRLSLARRDFPARPDIASAATCR